MLLLKSKLKKELEKCPKVDARNPSLLKKPPLVEPLHAIKVNLRVPGDPGVGKSELCPYC